MNPLQEEFRIGRLIWRNGGSEARHAVERRSGRAVSLIWPSGIAPAEEKLSNYLKSLPVAPGVLRYQRAARDSRKGDVIVIVAEAIDPNAQVLTDVLSKGRLRAREARWFVEQALRVLAWCHEGGKSLGPLRPRRFLVVSRPALGLQILPTDPPRGGTDDATTATCDECLGWAYLPPEAHQTPEKLGTPSEVYSLAAVMHTALTGELPFSVSAIGRGPAVADEIRAGYASERTAPPEWRLFLRRGMALDPAQRPSARELLRMLPPLRPKPIQRRSRGRPRRLNRA